MFFILRCIVYGMYVIGCCGISCIVDCIYVLCIYCLVCVVFCFLFCCVVSYDVCCMYRVVETDVVYGVVFIVFSV